MLLQFTVTKPNNVSNIIIPIAQTNDLKKELKSILGLDVKAFESFSADHKELFTTYTNGQNVYLLGLGKNPTAKQILHALRYFFHNHKTKIQGDIYLDYHHLALESLESAVNGIYLASYDIQLYKTNLDSFPNLFQASTTLTIGLANEEALAEAQRLAKRGEEIASTQKEVLNLVNAPSNKKIPQTLVDWATKSGKRYGYSVEVFDKEKLEKLGLQTIVAVSCGSANPPFMLVLEYKSQDAKTTIGLVGKGVTFDTGGFSLKDSTNMHYMKCDMAGAGGILGAIELCAKWNLPVHVVAVIPTTENTLDGLSLKPGDVIGSYLGKTIEVIDTDAEGRLILADGLAYLNKNYQPDVLIDMATLTGSCVATLGYVAGGYFTNNEALSQQIWQSAEATGERLWRLPLWDDYKGDISSDIADLRNYSGKPVAGAISAAKFLEVFTENHPAYAHIDMAGVSFTDSDFASMKSATAYGVRLLVDFLEKQQ